MATITKRTNKNGSTSYKVEVRLKGYPQQRATFSRLTDARAWARDTESDIKRGRHFKTTEGKRHTLADLVDRYTRDVLPTKKASTQPYQRRQLGWWKAELGDYTIADCTPALIGEARDKLAREPVKPKRPDSPPRYRSPASVVRYLAVLSHAFTVAAKEWGWLEDNPCLKVKKPREPRGRVRFLSDEERDVLLNACRESSSR